MAHLNEFKNLGLILKIRRLIKLDHLDGVFSTRAIANWLSQCMRRAGTGFCHIGIFSKRLRSHYASSVALSKAMISDSVVYLANKVCLEDFQYIAALYAHIYLWISSSLSLISSLHHIILPRLLVLYCSAVYNF